MKKLTYGISLLFLLVLQGCNSNNSSDDETVVEVAAEDGRFTTLVTALQATGLDETLSDESASFTVFAPTDEAFALLGEETINNLLADTDTLTDILTYHVLGSEVDASTAIASAGSTVATVNGKSIALSLDGSDLLVNTVTVTVTDIQADNGVIHAIDAVLTPPADIGSPMMNIVETAIADGNFTTLVTALQAAGLDSVLADPNAEFTVFAPTDAAFAALPAGTVTSLLSDIPTLTAILTQHVVSGSVDSITAYSLNGQSAQTLNNNVVLPIVIDSSDNSLSVGGANVSVVDIYTTNGIIHVIDSVIVNP